MRAWTFPARIVLVAELPGLPADAGVLGEAVLELEAHAGIDMQRAHPAQDGDERLRRTRPGTARTWSSPSEREILITRSFDAPARIVFEAITKPEHIRRWWAPKSLGEVLACEVDLRVGGAWRFVMRAKNGMEVGFSGKFLELDAPTRIVQTEVFEPFPDAVSVVTVTLSEVGGRTTLSSRVLYPSKEVRDQVLASGMERGMRESYSQLTDAVDALARG